jgi:hypothetical protein
MLPFNSFVKQQFAPLKQVAFARCCVLCFRFSIRNARYRSLNR